MREAQAALEAAVAAREASEQAYAAEQQRLQRLARAAADRREGLAKLAGQVGRPAQPASRPREAEIGRLRGTIEQSLERAAAAEQEFTALESSVAVDEEGEEGLDSAYEKAAAAALEQVEAEVEQHREAERVAERDRTSAVARLEALEIEPVPQGRRATLLAAADDRHGIVGSVASLLQVTRRSRGRRRRRPRLGRRRARRRVRRLTPPEPWTTLRADDAGRAAFLVGQTAAPSDPATWPALDGSAVWAREVVDAPATGAPRGRAAARPGGPRRRPCPGRGARCRGVTASPP